MRNKSQRYTLGFNFDKTIEGGLVSNQLFDLISITFLEVKMSEFLLFSEVLEKTELVFAYIKTTVCPERTGGYLCVLEEESGIPALIMKIGFVPADKKKKYFEFAQEKAGRLWVTHSHQLSFQSRDEKSNRYGGAIRARNFIFSFSGFTEEADEALCLILAVLLNQLEKSEALALAKISRNSYVEKFFPTN